MGRVLTNPGGPGETGRLLPLLFADRAELVASQEFIGNDPRGTGLSTNVGCAGKSEQGAKLNPRDRPWANLGKIMNASERVARAYQRDSGEFGWLVTTDQTVKDVDMMHVLLGRERINRVGCSGGTLVGPIAPLTSRTRSSSSSWTSTLSFSRLRLPTVCGGRAFLGSVLFGE